MRGLNHASSQIMHPISTEHCRRSGYIDSEEERSSHSRVQKLLHPSETQQCTLPSSCWASCLACWPRRTLYLSRSVLIRALNCLCLFLSFRSTLCKKSSMIMCLCVTEYHWSTWWKSEVEKKILRWALFFFFFYLNFDNIKHFDGNSTKGTGTFKSFFLCIQMNCLKCQTSIWWMLWIKSCWSITVSMT